MFFRINQGMKSFQIPFITSHLNIDFWNLRDILQDEWSIHNIWNYGINIVFLCSFRTLVQITSQTFHYYNLVKIGWDRMKFSKS